MLSLPIACGACSVNILGIETSSPVCSVGIVSDGGGSVERNIVDAHIHSEKLLTLMQEVLRQAELSLNDLDALAISIGPGSFTGLRIGLSTAKGLCYALDQRLIAVSTFDAVVAAVQDSKPWPGKINIAVDAKQGEFYFGSADLSTHDGTPKMKVRTERLSELRWTEFPGDSTLWITDRPDIIQHYGISPELIRSYSAFCRGDAVARQAIGKFGRAEFAELASIEPMYLKEFLVKTAIT
jgi:tRNA threonylcarbamoyladenosine biosynthesis protein TsaB